MQGDTPVEPAQEPRAEDGQESLADLPGVEGGGGGGVIHRSETKHHAVSECSNPSPSPSPPNACVAGHLVTIGDATAMGTSYFAEPWLVSRCLTRRIAMASRTGLGLPSHGVSGSETPQGGSWSNGGDEERVEYCQVGHLCRLRRPGRHRSDLCGDLPGHTDPLAPGLRPRQDGRDGPLPQASLPLAVIGIVLLAIAVFWE